MRSVISFVMLLLIPASAAFSQGRGDISLFAQGVANGPMNNWEITTKRFEAQPKWQPTNPILPLSIPKALEVADGWIRKKNPEVSKFAVASIALAPIGCCSNNAQDRWYFRVEFNPLVGGQRLYGGQFIAVVLFDGTVVEPRVDTR